ncbi:MAG: hypothetical protein FWG83_02035 [Oscillospiraceae bacterium]|nr:hypothetical protein [Oscillospiraceae bacterium]
MIQEHDIQSEEIEETEENGKTEISEKLFLKSVKFADNMALVLMVFFGGITFGSTLDLLVIYFARYGYYPYRIPFNEICALITFLGLIVVFLIYLFVTISRNDVGWKSKLLSFFITIILAGFGVFAFGLLWAFGIDLFSGFKREYLT